ncbi:MAG: TonB-dependent receptor [Steroidobacteraceae bacterium]
MSKLLACLSGAAVALAGASGASAQSASSGLELEEIVVTATKRDTDLQKTSISIQTYSGDQLKKEGKKRIDEIMEGVVGVQVQTSQVGSNFFMRGVDSGGAGAPGGAPSQTAVAVLIDGVYQNRAEVVRGGTLDVAQVEVARGTQSSNLGASAIAGAVSIVSNQPVFEYQASGSLGIGNYHLLNMEGVLNAPLTDNQALRIAYSSNKRDGYISSGAGDSDLQNVRVKYRWQATDSLNLVLTGSHQTIGGNGVSDGVLLATGQWVAYNPALAAVGSGSAYAGLNFNGITATGGTSLGVGCASSTIAGSAARANVIQTMGCPATFVAIRDGVYYWQRSNPWDDGYPADAWPNHPYRHTNIDSLSADINWTTGIGTLTVTPSVQHATFKSAEPPRGGWMAEDRKQDTRQFEARLASPNGSKLQWLAGVYYYYTNNSGTFQNITLPFSAGMAISVTQPATPTCPYATTTSSVAYCYTWSNTKESKQETKSVYANGTYPILDTLRVIAGVRYSRDDKSFISVPDGSNPGDVNGPFAPYDYTCSFLAAGYDPRTCANSDSWSAFTYNAGIEFDLRPESMVYAKYSTGYQPGGVTLVPSKKLELQQITLGMKNRFFDNKVQVNIEAFDTTYHNRTVQGGIPAVQLDVPGVAATATCTTGGGSYRVTKNNDGTGCLALNTAVTGTPTIKNLKSQGVDLELNFLPTSNDRIDASVEWLKSKYDTPPDILVAYPTVNQVLSAATGTGTGATALTAAEAQILIDKFAAQVQAYKGLTLQNSADWSGNLSYQHEFTFAGGSSLTPRIAGTYKSKYWSQSGAAASILSVNQAMQNGKGHYNQDGTVNLAIQPSYSLFDFFTTFRSADGKFSITGYIKNIENEPIMRNTNGNANVTLADPRTFGATFNANF